MKVVVCATGVTGQFADAPYSTLCRAEAMIHAGLSVTVVGMPEQYPSELPVLVPYVSVDRQTSRATRRRRAWGRRVLGRVWTYFVEPFLVVRAGLRLARAQSAEILFISHLEPLSMLPFAAVLRRRAWPRWVGRVAVGLPRGWVRDASLPTALRFVAYRSGLRRLAPRMPLLFGSPYMAPYMGLPEHPNLIDLPEGHEDRRDWMTKDAARRTLGLPLDRRMVLLFGVASLSKGGDLLLRAIEGLAPDFLVCLVGAGIGTAAPAWGAVGRALAAAWKDALVIVPRRVSDEEMYRFYAACDVVVLPYRAGFTDTSTHLRRATEFGKALVACDQHLIGATVRRYDLGLLFPPEDVEGLRRALADAVHRPDAWYAGIRERSGTLLREQSWAVVGEAYRALFERVASVARPVS